MIDLSVLFPKQKIYCYSSEQLVETCKTLYHYQKINRTVLLKWVHHI